MNKEWKRVHFNLPMEFDFNLDGVSSTDMIEEFECLGNTSFKLLHDNSIHYQLSFLSVTLSTSHPNNPDYIQEYYCDEEGVGINFYASFKMLDENTFRIERYPEYNNSYLFGDEFIAIFEIVDDKLVRRYSRRHPTSYDEENQVYNYEIIEVEEVFEYY
jgi:hypothetical protein